MKAAFDRLRAFVDPGYPKEPSPGLCQGLSNYPLHHADTDPHPGGNLADPETLAPKDVGVGSSYVTN